MGATQENPDVELVTDYAEQRSFVRLHLDIPVPDREVPKLRELMDGGRFREAMKLIEEISGGKSPFLDLYFGQRLLAISK